MRGGGVGGSAAANETLPGVTGTSSSSSSSSTALELGMNCNAIHTCNNVTHVSIAHRLIRRLVKQLLFFFSCHQEVLQQEGQHHIWHAWRQAKKRTKRRIEMNRCLCCEVRTLNKLSRILLHSAQNHRPSGAAVSFGIRQSICVPLSQPSQKRSLS